MARGGGPGLALLHAAEAMLAKYKIHRYIWMLHLRCVPPPFPPPPGDMCRANGTLLLVDTVCSLGGVPMYADAWGVDAIYSGSQKCLSAPPGASPVMMNERALAKIKGRKTKVRALLSLPFLRPPS